MPEDEEVDLDFSDDSEETLDDLGWDSDVDLDFGSEEETDETKKDPKEEEKVEDVLDEESNKDETDPKKESEEPWKEDSKKEDDSLDEIEKLLDEVDDSDDSQKKSEEAIDNIEKKLEEWDKDVEILKEENSNLKDSNDRLKTALKNINWEKADLAFKNAELEAFGWNFTDPSLLIVTKHYESAINWDEKAKTKTIKVIKDMYDILTWSDLEKEKADDKLDKISAIENYNNSSNPNFADKSNEDDYWIDV